MRIVLVIIDRKATRQVADSQGQIDTSHETQQKAISNPASKSKAFPKETRAFESCQEERCTLELRFPEIRCRQGTREDPPGSPSQLLNGNH